MQITASQITTPPTRKRVLWTALVCALAITVMAAPAPALAQDAPAVAPADEAQDARLQRLRRLFGVASARPSPPRREDLPADQREAAERIKDYRARRKEWDGALDAMVAISDAYLEAASGGGALEVRYFAGFARVRKSEVVSRDEAAVLLLRAEEHFRTFLDAAPADSAYRPDAGHQYTRVLLRNAGSDAERIAAACEVGSRAVGDLLASGAKYDAGALAFVVLKSLIEVEREEDAARIAAGWNVNSADWDVSTENVRRLARRAALRPGQPFPAMPAVDDADGARLDFAALRGRPFLLHLFSTVVSKEGGEVEDLIQPLRETWRPFGLAVVGISLDLALDDEKLAKTKANWDEWGRKEEVPDGRLPSVRAFCEARGVDWPWYWDGKWTENVLVKHLGVDANQPYVVLVDESGVIRFRGRPDRKLPLRVWELQSAFAKTPDGADLVTAAQAGGTLFPEAPQVAPEVVPVDPDFPVVADVPNDDEGDEEWDEDDPDGDGDDGESGRRSVLGLLLAVAAAVAVGLVLIFRKR